jgi:hypothetical protein
MRCGWEIDESGNRGDGEAKENWLLIREGTKEFEHEGMILIAPKGCQ